MFFWDCDLIIKTHVINIEIGTNKKNAKIKYTKNFSFLQNELRIFYIKFTPYN